VTEGLSSPSSDGGGGIGERLRSAGPLRPKRRNFCRPAAGGATEVAAALGPGLPMPRRLPFAAALQGLSLSRKSAALRHPWLRWPPTLAPGARAAPPRTSIRKGDGGRVTEAEGSANARRAPIGCGQVTKPVPSRSRGRVLADSKKSGPPPEPGLFSGFCAYLSCGSWGRWLGADRSREKLPRKIAPVGRDSPVRSAPVSAK